MALIVSLVRVVAAVAWLMVPASVVVVVGIVGIALQPQPNIFQRPEEAHPIVGGYSTELERRWALGSLEAWGWCVSGL